MKKLLCILVVIIMFHMNGYKGETKNDWEELNQISDVAWQLAKQNRFQEAEQLLRYFEEQFSEISVVQAPYTVDELKTIHSSKEHAYKVLLDETKSKEEKIKAMTQLRLVVDAITSEYQPLWSTMEEPIMTTFSQLKEDMENGDIDSFEEEWDRFISLYRVIYPSLTVDVSEQNIKRIETHISAIEDKMYANMTAHTQFQQLTAMEDALQDLFNRTNEDETDPSLIWVMISTGSIIFLALSYVGWRKYTGETRKNPSKENSEHM